MIKIVEKDTNELISYENNARINDDAYSESVEIARKFIKDIGGFEKFAEWGLF